MKYNVPIVYRGQSNYVIDADTKEEAEKIARDLFNNAESPTILGNEWEGIERVGEIEPI